MKNAISRLSRLSDGNVLLAPLSGDKTSKDFNLFVARQFSFSYIFLRLMFMTDHEQVYVKHKT